MLHRIPPFRSRATGFPDILVIDGMDITRQDRLRSSQRPRLEIDVFNPVLSQDSFATHIYNRAFGRLPFLRDNHYLTPDVARHFLEYSELGLPGTPPTILGLRKSTRPFIAALAQRNMHVHLADCAPYRDFPEDAPPRPEYTVGWYYGSSPD